MSVLTGFAWKRRNKVIWCGLYAIAFGFVAKIRLAYVDGVSRYFGHHRRVRVYGDAPLMDKMSLLLAQRLL